jgi:CheY-like chemotaxis protein
LEESSQAHVPIVALTADAMQGTDELCRAAGMDAYLTKPLDLAKVRETIARLLDGSLGWLDDSKRQVR